MDHLEELGWGTLTRQHPRDNNRTHRLFHMGIPLLTHAVVEPPPAAGRRAEVTCSAVARRPTGR